MLEVQRISVRDLSLSPMNWAATALFRDDTPLLRPSARLEITMRRDSAGNIIGSLLQIDAARAEIQPLHWTNDLSQGMLHGIGHGLEEMALLYTPSDDKLLAVEVEQALKALDMVSNHGGHGAIRTAVETLRRSETRTIHASPRRVRDVALAPALLASDIDIVIL